MSSDQWEKGTEWLPFVQRKYLISNSQGAKWVSSSSLLLSFCFTNIVGGFFHHGHKRRLLYIQAFAQGFKAGRQKGSKVYFPEKLYLENEVFIGPVAISLLYIIVLCTISKCKRAGESKYIQVVHHNLGEGEIKILSVRSKREWISDRQLEVAGPGNIQMKKEKDQINMSLGSRLIVLQIFNMKIKSQQQSFAEIKVSSFIHFYSQYYTKLPILGCLPQD